MILTSQSSQFIKALIEELEIPEDHYKRAERSYQSFGEWTQRAESSLLDYAPEVYVQGSFRLGTVIKPSSDADEYDIDMVCVLAGLQKSELSQKTLKEMLETEVQSYRDAKGIKKPVKSGRRCWTLEYADSAQFHMDILPALPNAEAQRILLEKHSFDASFADSAIAITDDEHETYNIISDEWPRSNPKGYAEWFKSRMAEVFQEMRKVIAESEMRKGVKASVEDIPEYRVRTPLQQSIMILKRHRDDMYADDTDNRKPISIIISTLAAHSYQGETEIGEALLGILERMESHIAHNGSEYVIANPTDGSENFADKWQEHPEREKAFFKWLTQAKKDFSALANLTSFEKMVESATTLKPELTNRALQRAMGISGVSLLGAATSAPAAAQSDYSFSDTPRQPKAPRDFA